MKHNNQLPNQHFRKHWQLRVKTWFDQPGKKASRRRARTLKAAKQPQGFVKQYLRPAVRCTTVRYNRRMRLGRGFSLEELKAAGVHPKNAAKIGIAVDLRRKNRSEESLARNVQRLKAYKEKLLVLNKKTKSLADANVKPEQLLKVRDINDAFPIPKDTPVVARPITESERQFKAYAALRKARINARYHDARTLKAKRRADREADSKK